jgi:integrase
MILADAVAKKLIPANPVTEWKATQVRGRSGKQAQARRIAASKVLDSEEREQLLAAFETKEPHYYPLVLFLAETGCRIGEAITLTWPDLDLRGREARLYRHKTGGEPDDVELSERLVSVLRQMPTPIGPAGVRVFRTPARLPIRHENFRHRQWQPIVRDLFGKSRRLTPHSLRHTWATLHLARGTPIKWVQAQGGWSSARMLLDVYGHAIKREMQGYSDALAPRDRNRPEQTEKEGSK